MAKKPDTPVDAYYLSMHLGLCLGPVELLALAYGEKFFWNGHITYDVGPIRVDDAHLNLFGGLEKEGGVAGYFWFLPGHPDQTLDEALAARLGKTTATCPGFRGLSTIFFIQGRHDEPGFYWSANNPYLRDLWALVRRKPSGLDPDLAMVPRPGGSDVVLRTEVVNLHSEDNAGFDAELAMAAGVTLTGFNPENTLRLTLPSGGVYVAWSPWGEPDIDDLTSGSTNRFTVIKDGDPDTAFLHGDIERYDGYEAARVAFGTEFTSGASDYTFCIVDEPIDDNTGGLSITVEELLTEKLDANPANIIYECLTDPDFGMGASENQLDMQSFRDAQSTLYAEGFGLSLWWMAQDKIENFIGEILNHIRGTLYVSPRTGLLTLKLFRNDYDLEDLPEINPTNAQLSNFQRKAFGEITNEITVTWTNPDTEKEETVTVHDLGMIAHEGQVIPDSRNYYGIRYRDLAVACAERDLRASSFPLASCEAEVNRSLYSVFPGSVVKVTWPERNLISMAMRVGPVDYGAPDDEMIKLNLMEDVFAFTKAEYGPSLSTAWTDSRTTPTDMDFAHVMTAPYFFFARTGVDPEVRPYPEVTSMILASDAAIDCSGYSLLSEEAALGGGTEYVNQGILANIGHGELTDALVSEAISTLVTFDNTVGKLLPETNRFVMICPPGADEADTELCLITAETDGVCTLRRGCLDTVPRAWPAGTHVWFFDQNTALLDPEPRASGESPDYKLLTRTGLGELAVADAEEVSETLSDRPHLPTRPANCTVEGVNFLAEDDFIDARENGETYVLCDWVERNRLLEDGVVSAWADSAMTAESGQTTTITILRPDTRAVIATVDGLTDADRPYELPKASFSTFHLGIVRFTSKRDGFESLTGHELLVQVESHTADTTLITADSTLHSADEA